MTREELSDIVDFQLESEKRRVAEAHTDKLRSIVQNRTDRFRRAVVIGLTGVGMGGFNVYRFMEHNDFNLKSVAISVGLAGFAAFYTVYARGKAHLEVNDLYTEHSDYLREYFKG